MECGFWDVRRVSRKWARSNGPSSSLTSCITYIIVLFSACVHLVMATTRQSLSEFLIPLAIDVKKIHELAKSLSTTFISLAAESENQFLATPISDSILRTEGDDTGR